MSFNSFSQEFLSFSINNPELSSEKAGKFIEKCKIKGLSDTLELPFWDDFSSTQLYPDQAKWTDMSVYINSNFCQKMPSLGIATFDAIDSTGNIYPNADYETSFVADRLSSRPINLNYPGETSIYLSFFYKPEGYGNEPEYQDSLVLEFYAPKQKKWHSAWKAYGQSDKDFDFEIIQISDTAFLQKGFRFRFKNYASLGSNTYPSLAGNSDFWHIDYVYLNKNRNQNDSVQKDIAFSKPFNTLLNSYTAMPWQHYKSMTNKPVSPSFKVTYTNNDRNMRLLDSLNFYLQDLSGQTAVQKLQAGAYNIPPFNQTELMLANPFTFPNNDNKFADFELTAQIITASYDSTINNSLTYTQKFRDYYSYDDGSAEAGYGLFGNGTKYGSVAYKFYPEKEDYLTGVEIYFTRTFDNASMQYFWLEIRNQKDNLLPESTPLLSLEGVRPEYENELNKFHLYKLEEPLLITDTFFIGWTQTTEDMLNVGYDFNTDASSKLYYNISGNWVKSGIAGALMIRPVFGEFYVSTPVIEAKNELEIYPNPAKNNINVSASGKMYIYDINGKLLFHDNNFESGNINISTLTPGIYLIKIISEEKVQTRKFVVN